MTSMTMPEKAKTRAHMRAAGIDPRDLSAREFVEYAKRHGIMDEPAPKHDLTATDAAPHAEPEPMDDPYDIPDDADDEGESEGEPDADDDGESEGEPDADDDGESEGEPDADDDGESEDEPDADDEDDEDDAPEPPPPASNPIEEMIDDRVKALIDQHTHADTHKLQSAATGKALKKLRGEIKKMIAEQAPAPTEHRKRELREKTHVRFDHTHKLFKPAAKVLELGHNLYLHGPAGSGKTTLAKQLAKVFDKPFYMIGRVDDIFLLTGYKGADGNYVETDFYRAFTTGGVFLGDEMDRWAGEALTGLNAAISNGYMAFPNGMQDMHPDFVMISAGNTLAKGHDRVYTAAQALDGSSMNRFTKLEMDYDEKLEHALAIEANPDAADWIAYVQKARANAKRHRMDLIISPRDTVNGAELLAAGFGMKAVKEMTFAAGLTTNEMNQLEA